MATARCAVESGTEPSPRDVLMISLDGGQVEAWESDVFVRIQDADEDKSGTISVKELYAVIRRAAESDRQKRLYRTLALVATALLLLMLLANMGLTAAVVFLAKDTSVGADGALVAASTGEVVRVQCMSAPSQG